MNKRIRSLPRWLPWLFGLAAIGLPAASPLKVTIQQPRNGWSAERILELVARVSDAKVPFAQLVENGTERMVRVHNGEIRQKLVLSPGHNLIVVSVRHQGRVASDSVSLFSQVAKKDIKVVLTWDTDQTDVDLHVTNPSAEECYYGFRETREGGVLDVDITDGYGPEVFTQANALAGEYEVKVVYFSAHGNAQSRALVQVILFEGTGQEQRFRFTRVLTRDNDTYVLGRFRVEPQALLP